MNRRSFLLRAGSLVVVLPAGRWMMACGDSGLTFKTSVDGGHSHTVVLLPTELETPPAQGVTKLTSDSGHTHTVELSESELTEIQAGGSVTKSTSTDELHSHTVVFEKSKAI